LKNEFLEKKIINYIYFQPELTVSIDKILNKFNSLTKDELNNLLHDMYENRLINLYPTSTMETQVVGQINDETGEYKRIEDGEVKPILIPQFIGLTLEGKNIAEEHKQLLMKSTRQLILKPLINTSISTIVGIVIGWIIHSYF